MKVKKKKKIHELSLATRRALTCYADVQEAQRALEELNNRFFDAYNRIPQEEHEAYLKEAAKIQRKTDDKVLGL